MPLKPVLSNATALLTHDVEAVVVRGCVSFFVFLVVWLLTLYVDKRELVTLMTLGGAPEALILGYLRNQRLVKSIEDIESVQVDWSVDAVAVRTRNGIEDIEERTSKRVVTTGCGQGSVFGGLTDQEDTIVLPAEARLRQSVLYKIVDTIRTQQSIYKQAGSVHEYALFSSDGDMFYFVEDVGHQKTKEANTSKKKQDEIGGEDKVFYTTGRLT